MGPGGEGSWDRAAGPRARNAGHGAEARRGEAGGRRARAAGRDPWKPSDVTGPRRPPGPRLSSCPRPCPRRPARGGPPASSGGLRVPPPAPLPRAVFLAPRRTRLPRGAGGVGALGAGGAADRRRARRAGQMDAGLPGEQMLGQKVGGHHGDRRILLLPTAAHRGAPFPTTLAPRSDSQGPAPWASRAPSRTRLARKAKLPATAWDSGSRGASGWRQMGEGRGGSTSRRRGESLITRACPGCPALCPLPLPGTSRACSPLPSGTSLPATVRSPGEKLWLLSQGADSQSREGDWGNPRGLGGTSARQMVTPRGQGAEESSLSSPRTNSTCSPPGHRLHSAEPA